MKASEPSAASYFHFVPSSEEVVNVPRTPRPGSSEIESVSIDVDDCCLENSRIACAMGWELCSSRLRAIDHATCTWSFSTSTSWSVTLR